MTVHYRPITRTDPGTTTQRAGDQPGATPYFDTDPTRTDLPHLADGTPVPLLYVSDGSTGVTGEDGDLILAVPNGSGGVDIAVAADLSGSLSVGIDTTGLL